MEFSHKANICLRAGVGLDPVSGRLIHRLASRFCATALAGFYQHLSRACPQAERLFLVMDNWPNHHHPLAWKAIEADARIRVLWLPTYAPWLNPAEKVWKWLRQRLTHMHPFANAWRVFREQVDRTLASANENAEAMPRCTGTGKYKLYAS